VRVGIAPIYPPDLKRDRVQGVVDLVFIVMEDGSIAKLDVEESSSLAFAIEAVQKWKFALGIKIPAASSGVFEIRLEQF